MIQKIYIIISDLCSSEENNRSVNGNLIFRNNNDLPLSGEENIKIVENIDLDNFTNFVKKYCTKMPLNSYLLYNNSGWGKIKSFFSRKQTGKE